MIKIAVICGGPSPERGISLNSARSLLDHLPSDIFEVYPLYVDQKKQFYSIFPSQLYSNTPGDFDFKLKQIGQEVDLSSFFKTVDLVFPAIHGPFGDDGELQSLLEKYHVPFVGSKSQTCRRIFLKHLANLEIKRLGYPVLPYTLITEGSKIPPILGRTIVKPSSGGSSIGVYSVDSQEEAQEKTQILFQLFEDKHVILEPFCKGKEFTIVVFQSHDKGIEALTPTEIETSYENHQILDYRKKYLPTHQTFYHTPPRFKPETIEKIQTQAKDLFLRLEIRDFIRMDGWVMEDGTIYFSDFNPICGLEQNSFLFRQAAANGFTHEEILLAIIQNACHRESIPIPSRKKPPGEKKKKVFVLLGGNNAERQVSLMSGTNVWLKLLRSDRFEPIPFLLDPNESIWELPYHFALNHTVEEIYANCLASPSYRPIKLNDFIKQAKKEDSFVFIGLHGGMGENGELQKLLEDSAIPFNGSHSSSSFLCMDKSLTGKKIQDANDPDILSLPKKIISLDNPIWDQVTKELKAEKLIIKPQSDGCSSGVVLLQNAKDLQKYIDFVHRGISTIPPFSFCCQTTPIEMPSIKTQGFLLEPYIECDLITVQNNELLLTSHTGWIELTVGVLEQEGRYSSLNPSITVAQNGVLTLEEKFQGGTGINITPPPESILSSPMIEKIKRMIEKAAYILGIHNYARIDVFFNRFTKKMIVIEANTLPGLTPSTVLYHQALAENPPLSPRKFLELIIENAMKKSYV